MLEGKKPPTKNFEKQELKVSSNQNIWELGTQQSNLVFLVCTMKLTHKRNLITTLDVTVKSELRDILL